MKGFPQFLLAIILIVCVNYISAGTNKRQPLMIARISENEDDECQAGEKKKVSCNECFCANGAWACTKIACPADQGNSSREKRQTRGNECQDGQNKHDGCNQCFCSSGYWACTLKACLRKRAAPVCTPGQTNEIGCNKCRCIAGDWACSKKICA